LVNTPPLGRYFATRPAAAELFDQPVHLGERFPHRRTGLPFPRHRRARWYGNNKGEQRGRRGRPHVAFRTLDKGRGLVACRQGGLLVGRVRGDGRVPVGISLEDVACPTLRLSDVVGRESRARTRACASGGDSAHAVLLGLRGTELQRRAVDPAPVLTGVPKPDIIRGPDGDIGG
jgi:hypothetical protein